MRRVFLIPVFLLLSCMPGGCQQRMAERMGERVVEKAIESQMKAAGGREVDIGSVNLKGEAREYAPPGFRASFLGETEDGFMMAGVVKGKTQEDLAEFFISKLGKPSGRFVMGDQLHLAWNDKDTYVVINGKSGSIELYVAKGKKAKGKIGR